ncbi:MAG: hypothetical protein ASARMPRED_007653 [Alectoria sarmentosa]|nr:MAG: hypothetical protein ASARMPRED_007653 [Alectoria sarmentosa]
MPRRTDQMTCNVSERENFEHEEPYFNHHTDRECIEESASEIEGRYGGPRPRGFRNSDRGGPRIARSRDMYSHCAIDPDRAYGDSLTGQFVGHRSGGTRGHRGLVREDYNSFDNGYLAVESTGRRFGETRGHRGMRGVYYEYAFDDDSLTGEYTGPRYGEAPGQREQGPPYSRGTGRRYCGTSTEEFTDDEPDYRPRGARSGMEVSASYGTPSSRHRELSPSPCRGGMYPIGRAGSVDYSGLEAGLGGHIPGLRQYGSQRDAGLYGHSAGGRDSNRCRY